MMKKGKILLLLLLAGALLCLAGCGADSEMPEGMKLCQGGDAYGYNFYVPEEWAVSNGNGIASAYISRLNRTSVSLMEIDPPEGTAEEYFTEAQEDYTFPVTATPCEPCTFGNAEEAAKTVFSFRVGETDYREMLILSSYEGRYYLFLYHGSVTERNGTVDYTEYLEKAQTVIDNVLFYGRVDKPEPEEGEHVTDADGYLRLGNKREAGFLLYVPGGYTVSREDAFIQAAAADGSNVTMTAAGETGVKVSDYWESRKAELENYVSDLTEIEVTESVSFGNAKAAFACEYTYRYGGETYHVYQVMAVTTFKGVVFTYTATDANFEGHRAEIEAMCRKVLL